MATKKKNTKTYSFSVNLDSIKADLLEQAKAIKTVFIGFCKYVLGFALFGLPKSMFVKCGRGEVYPYLKAVQNIIYVCSVLFAWQVVFGIIVVRIAEGMSMDTSENYY